MDDEQIIDLYFARDERALTETDHKYGGYCFHIANGILDSVQDAEETVSDTYWKAWNQIPPTRPTVFKMFLAKITRNLAFSRWRQNAAQKRGRGEMQLVLDELADCIPTPEGVEDNLNAKELSRSIQTFLDTLSIREQNIFLRRYFFLEESEVIAQRYGMKSGAVLRTLSRTRAKLKQHLAKEGYLV